MFLGPFSREVIKKRLHGYKRPKQFHGHNKHDGSDQVRKPQRPRGRFVV